MSYKDLDKRREYLKAYYVANKKKLNAKRVETRKLSQTQAKAVSNPSQSLSQTHKYVSNPVSTPEDIVSIPFPDPVTNPKKEMIEQLRQKIKGMEKPKDRSYIKYEYADSYPGEEVEISYE